MGCQRAAVWASFLGGLSLACPQLRDDDFAHVPASIGGASGEADTTPPSVVASAPSDGASGVPSDAQIEIRFSEPMDTSATEAAYGSSELPPSDVGFSWRDDDSVLVIAPARPLTIASGSDRAQVTAREYSLELGAGARDRAGNPLAPFSLSFDAARELTRVIDASVDRTLSGNWRSDGNYGVEVCEIADATICVGDSPAAGVPTYRGFVTFDLNALPSD
ncbi:MAG TPA: Ig-like domain-containing protein, partial [Polyangiaceae bacterium]|nr:Ig-like domain-containing protein [Polyangiaceae bacterium]